MKHTELNITPEIISAERDREVLLRWLDTIKDDISKMNASIDKASNNDPEWLHAITTKKKIYGSLLNRVQTQLSIVNKNHAERYRSTFIDVCWEKLPKDVVSEIDKEAKQRIELWIKQREI